MRSVPGPWSLIASKRRSVRRAAFDFSSSTRSVQEAVGSSVSSRQIRTTASHSRSSASSRVELRIDRLRPRRRRGRDDRPVGRALVDDLAGLGQVGQHVATRATGIDPFERARRVRPGERDARCVLVGQVVQALAEPRRDEVERVLGRVLDALALDPLVEVEDVDVLRAAEVGGPRDLARERLLPDEARDGDVLALLDVRAEDGELGEALEPALALALVASWVAVTRAPYRRHNAPVRLNAYLARAGVASRRRADELIRDGRVVVNGEPGELQHAGALGRRRGGGRELASPPRRLRTSCCTSLPASSRPPATRMDGRPWSISSTIPPESSPSAASTRTRPAPSC